MRDRAAPARLGLLALLLWTAAGCATSGGPTLESDPWEPMNRGIFAFNETVDRYALEPVAKGWDFVLPGFVQTGIENFFDNVRMPIVLANDLLQAKPVGAGYDFLRFFYNTTFGIAGFIDVATMVELPDNDEDFGQTLGVWGVPPGPYLVVPLLGPYTIRSGAGAVVDSVGAPQGWFIPIWASVGLRGVELLNLRAIYLEEIAESRAEAFDYYAFVRNAYLQNRKAKVADRTDEPAIDDEELYYFDDEEDFDDSFDEGLDSSRDDATGGDLVGGERSAGAPSTGGAPGADRGLDEENGGKDGDASD